MNDLKPIETYYKGYRFRSRLEARWAVFFDALGIEWEYEKEGFYLGKYENKIIKYLPDFYFPELELWVEIKPSNFFKTREINLIEKLREESGDPCLLISGEPGKEDLYFYAFDTCDSGCGCYEAYPEELFWYISEEYGPTINHYVARKDRILTNGSWTEIPQFYNLKDGIYNDINIKLAYKAARSARFEFGESG